MFQDVGRLGKRSLLVFSYLHYLALTLPSSVWYIAHEGTFAMRIFRYINAKSCIQALPTLVLNKFWSGFSDDDVVPATSIEKRQVSGVVATSQFLRRAYQACE
jgi:hypothetical protein